MNSKQPEDQARILQDIANARINLASAQYLAELGASNEAIEVDISRAINTLSALRYDLIVVVRPETAK